MYKTKRCVRKRISLHTLVIKHYEFTEESFLNPCAPKICHLPTPSLSNIAFLSSAQSFWSKGQRISEQQIQHLLQEHDILLPRPAYLRESAYEEFSLHSGHEKDLVLLRQAVESIDPAVLPAYDRVMAGNRLHLFNMLIAPAAVFDAYCAWLFAVLFELEKHVDMTGYTPYEQRLYGFLSERLLNVFVLHHGLHVGVLPVRNTEQTTKQKWRLRARQLKNRVLFALKK